MNYCANASCEGQSADVTLIPENGVNVPVCASLPADRVVNQSQEGLGLSHAWRLHYKQQQRKTTTTTTSEIDENWKTSEQIHQHWSPHGGDKLTGCSCSGWPLDRAALRPTSKVTPADYHGNRSAWHESAEHNVTDREREREEGWSEPGGKVKDLPTHEGKQSFWSSASSADLKLELQWETSSRSSVSLQCVVVWWLNAQQGASNLCHIRSIFAVALIMSSCPLYNHDAIQEREREICNVLIIPSRCCGLMTTMMKKSFLETGLQVCVTRTVYVQTSDSARRLIIGAISASYHPESGWGFVTVSVTHTVTDEVMPLSV